MPTLMTAILLVSTAAGCSHGQPRADRQPAVVLAPDGAPEVRVRVELARTAEEQARGLMFRQRLEPGWGMLFVNDKPRHLTFWMHNTYIPLDMLFIKPDRTVLGVVERAEPLTDETRAVPGDSQFVLEVPGGFAAEHRIGPGTRATFVDID